jgi:hypothetical protein
VAVHSDVPDNLEWIECDLFEHVDDILEPVLHESTLGLLVHLGHHNRQLCHSLHNFLLLETINRLIKVCHKSSFLFQALAHLIVGDVIGVGHAVEELDHLGDVARGD